MAHITQPIMALTNVPDMDTARAIARRLVENRVAACVNCLPQVNSIYRWQNTVEEASEITLLIKTTHRRYSEMEAMIKEMHPYELPEIVALAITGGLPAYLKWIEQETQTDETI